MQYRYEGNIFSGEKRSELLVVPALSVRVSPEIAIVPASSGRASSPERGARPVAGPGGGIPRAAAPGRAVRRPRHRPRETRARSASP